MRSKIVLGLMKMRDTEEWKVTVNMNGQYREDLAYYTENKNDALDTAISEAKIYKDRDYTVHYTDFLQELLDRRIIEDSLVIF